MSKGIDKKDWNIMYHLCQDSRTSHTRIAKLVGLSKNATKYRINRLMQIGIIAGFFTIIDMRLLGATSYTILCRVNRISPGFIRFLKDHQNIIVVDGFVGKWNMIIEFACKDTFAIFNFLSVLKTNYSDIIDSYELHPDLEWFMIEQLPVELVKEKKVPRKAETNHVELDNAERILLSELNKNSNAPLLRLAERSGLHYKTVAAKLKSLKEKGVIVKFTTNISLYELGYRVYVVLLDFRNLSATNEHMIKSFLASQTNIRAAFLSAAKPRIFIYLAVKDSDELGDFLLKVNERFGSSILDEEILLSSDQWKYDLFPDGILM